MEIPEDVMKKAPDAINELDAFLVHLAETIDDMPENWMVMGGMLLVKIAAEMVFNGELDLDNIDNLSDDSETWERINCLWDKDSARYITARFLKEEHNLRMNDNTDEKES